MCEVKSQGLLRPYSPSLSILGSFNPALSFVFIDLPSVWEGWYEYVLVDISMCACRFERVWKEAWLWKEVFLGCCLFLFEMGTLTQPGVYRICYAAWLMNFKISICVSDPPDTCYRHAAGPGFHKGAGNPDFCPQDGQRAHFTDWAVCLLPPQFTHHVFQLLLLLCPLSSSGHYKLYNRSFQFCLYSYVSSVGTVPGIS